MKRGSLVTLIAAAASISSFVATARPARAETLATYRFSQLEAPSGGFASRPRAEIRPALDVRLGLFDGALLLLDREARDRRAFDTLAWLPLVQTRTEESDPRPVLRQVFGRRLVREDGFNLFFMRGKHVLTAELGPSTIAIAPMSLMSPTDGTMLTFASVF
jgi:hypothetical protein